MFLLKFCQAAEALADRRFDVFGVEALVAHMVKPGQLSVIDDDNPRLPTDASEKLRSPWGERIIQCLAGKPQAWLATRAGITKSNLSDIVRKTMPAADTAFRLAQALDVPAQWLITGEMPGASLIVADEADWVMVPHYRLGEFTEAGKPEPFETVPLRKDWLNRNARVATRLWLTQLPSTILEDVGEEGDTILCRDAINHDEEGTYLYFWNGTPIVRRFVGPKLGDLADGSRVWHIEPDDPDGMRIAARIIGTIKLRPV